ncbi:PAS domain S-box protein [Sorangium sp. So ce1036]|uniref:PAS domain-containing hybrid sensor histidine kinase/response regulator n=1 Tax=Sorangium sp. So ce1036 TaxID=3133328 RepID=UPI003F0AC7B7
MEQEKRPRQDAWQDELYRLLIENAKDYGILIVDPEGKIIAWNPGAAAVLGYAEEEILGAPVERIYTPEDVQAGLPALEMGTARSVGRASDERWHLRKDGTRVYCSGVMTPLRDEQGDLRGFAKVLRDFTDRHLANKALRESEERLQIALEAAQMGTWLWHVRPDRLSLGPGLRRLMAVPPDREVQRLDDFIGLVHPDDQGAVREAFDAVLREGAELAVDFRVARADGSVRWLRDRGKLFRDPSGTPAYMTGACVDITERKQLEEALRERAEQLAEADRRKDEFLAMLGHELRNPLAPVRSILEVLRHARHDPARVDSACAMIERQIEHLVRLVDDLLDVARITRGKIHLHRGAVSLSTIVTQAVDTVRPLVEARGHELMISLPMKPVQLDADATRMIQVIDNLLHNAIKYTEPGGKIWLTCERARGGLEIRVKDTGQGMAPDLVPDVFDLFTQGERLPDRSQGGLGIGLTLVRRLVEMHGGTVHARSEGSGKGSEFSVWLPPAAVLDDARGAAGPSAAAPAPGRPAAASARRILVVDDNADAAESLVMLLEALGHEVRMARDGHEALETVAAFQPELVLLDIGLPGMDGYEVARRLRACPGLAGARLVALTGYGQDEDRRRSREAGFDHHLVKPISQKVLLPLIGSLERRRDQDAV